MQAVSAMAEGCVCVYSSLYAFWQYRHLSPDLVFVMNVSPDHDITRGNQMKRQNISTATNNKREFILEGLRSKLRRTAAVQRQRGNMGGIKHHASASPAVCSRVSRPLPALCYDC